MAEGALYAKNLALDPTSFDAPILEGIALEQPVTLDVLTQAALKYASWARGSLERLVVGHLQFAQPFDDAGTIEIIWKQKTVGYARVGSGINLWNSYRTVEDIVMVNELAARSRKFGVFPTQDFTAMTWSRIGDPDPKRSRFIDWIRDTAMKGQVKTVNVRYGRIRKVWFWDRYKYLSDTRNPGSRQGRYTGSGQTRLMLDRVRRPGRLPQKWTFLYYSKRSKPGGTYSESDAKVPVNQWMTTREWVDHEKVPSFTLQRRREGVALQKNDVVLKNLDFPTVEVLPDF